MRSIKSATSLIVFNVIALFPPFPGQIASHKPQPVQSAVLTPIVNFNALVFERNPNDSNNLRIGCIDIALLRNMLSEKNGPMYAESPLIRFSIQSVPSFLMCINGEAIRIPRNGIYEIKNGIILIDSFTPVAHCQLQSNEFVNWKNGSSDIPCINSEIYDNPDRKLYPFTVDYLYYQIELI